MSKLRRARIVSNGRAPRAAEQGPETGLATDGITLSVGCELTYTTPTPAPLLLQIQPRSLAHQKLVSESLASNTAVPVNRCEDTHGNSVMRVMLTPGRNVFRYEALVRVPDTPDMASRLAPPDPIGKLPLDVLRYTYPSRYCESDSLVSFASQRFGGLAPGLEQVRAVCAWVHENIEYRCGSGNTHESAKQVMHRGHGVCRDLAHVMVALCRALDLPARYVAGYIPRLPENRPDPASDMGTDFHAYCEVFLGGRWLTFDPRHNRRLWGRVKIAHGMDAVDTAIATMYGNVTPLTLRVWSHQVDLASPAGQPVIGAHCPTGQLTAAAAAPGA